MCGRWKHGCPCEPPKPPERVILTPWDDEYEASAIAIEKHEPGFAPVALLKMGLLLSIRMNAYTQGVKDCLEGKVRYGSG